MRTFTSWQSDFKPLLKIQARLPFDSFVCRPSFHFFIRFKWTFKWLFLNSTSSFLYKVLYLCLIGIRRATLIEKGFNLSKSVQSLLKYGTKNERPEPNNLAPYKTVGFLIYLFKPLFVTNAKHTFMSSCKVELSYGSTTCIYSRKLLLGHRFSPKTLIEIESQYGILSPLAKHFTVSFDWFPWMNSVRVVFWHSNTVAWDFFYKHNTVSTNELFIIEKCSNKSWLPSGKCFRSSTVSPVFKLCFKPFKFSWKYFKRWLNHCVFCFETLFQMFHAVHKKKTLVADLKTNTVTLNTKKCRNSVK